MTAEPVTRDVNALTRAFVRLRDARHVLKQEFKAADELLQKKQALIEGAMLKFLQDHKLDSAPTESGVFYRQEEITPSCADWSAFYAWIKENDAFEALEKRIKKPFVAEYLQAHEGELPPGVNAYREYVVRVRRG